MAYTASRIPVVSAVWGSNHDAASVGFTLQDTVGSNVADVLFEGCGFQVALWKPCCLQHKP